MKLEKINDNQIRCTLTRDDLNNRQIKLSELAYGTEKAKELFRDMMQQAAIEFGFEADNIPLMIEAIPLPNECIVLIITKVEDPEELDTKFSSFAPGIREENGMLDDMPSELNTAAEVLDLFRKIQDSVLSNSGNARSASGIETKASDTEEEEYSEEKENPNLTRMFTFSSLANVNKLAQLVGTAYQGANALYKDEAYGTYILVTTKGSHTREEYNRFCNMVSEYGSMHKAGVATERFLEEHLIPIIKDTALQTLAAL